MLRFIAKFFTLFFLLSLSFAALFIKLLIHISVHVSRPATFHEMWFRCVTVAAFVSFTITGITQLSVDGFFFLSFSFRFSFGYTVLFCCPRRGWLLPLLFLLLLRMCAIQAHTVYIFTRIDDSAHKDNFLVDPMQLSRFHSVFCKMRRELEIQQNRKKKLLNKLNRNGSISCGDQVEERMHLDWLIHTSIGAYTWHMLKHVTKW